jgi:hypothetical protein
MPAHDGTDLLGVAARVPMCRVPAEFKIHSVEEGLIGRIRLYEQCPELKSIVGQRTIPADAVERQVKPRLEPAGDPVCPLWNAVERVVWNNGSGKVRGRTPIGRVIVVQGQIEYAWRGNFGVIDLNLIRLRVDRCGPREPQHPQYR